MLKLNLGSGPTKLIGYENVDLSDGKAAFPLTVPAGSVDEIRASHVLEHFSHKQVFDVLMDWVKALKVGGTLKIAVPDLDWIISRHQAGAAEPLQQYLMGSQSDENDIHKSAFTYSTLEGAMREAGLANIKSWKSEINDCAALPVSLNLQGTKKRKIAACWSLPKLGHTDNFRCAASIFPAMDIEMRLGTGVFWDQILTRMMEELTRDGFEWFFTLDYDTIFTRDHVVMLMDLMGRYPDADAIFPVETRREGDSPLFVLRDEKDEQIKEHPMAAFKQDLIKTYSGHFGLTLFRASAFKDLPKPWFVGVPDKDGGWGDGRIDPDIYFWQNWSKAGRNLYMANRVVIGHAQQVVTWATTAENQWRPIQQYATDFTKVGPPAEIAAIMKGAAQ